MKKTKKNPLKIYKKLPLPFLQLAQTQTNHTKETIAGFIFYKPITKHIK